LLFQTGLTPCERDPVRDGFPDNAFYFHGFFLSLVLLTKFTLMYLLIFVKQTFYIRSLAFATMLIVSDDEDESVVNVAFGSVGIVVDVVP